MLFYQKRFFVTLNPSIFLPLYKPLIRPHLEYAIQASSPILSRDCQELGSVQKCATPFMRQRLQLFSLVHRRILGDLICMYKIMHGLLDFSCNAAFAAPTRFVLRGHTFKVHQPRCKTRRRYHAFSVREVPYWNNLPEEIVNFHPQRH